jgi:hypothetical protein
MLKTKRINAKLTKQEMALLREMQKSYKMSLSELLRELIWFGYLNKGQFEDVAVQLRQYPGLGKLTVKRGKRS